jgi:fibronectin type 3 domain-containing protein
MKQLVLILLLCASALANGQSSLPKATAYETQITWVAPVNSPDPVAGYDVFRALSPGTSYQQINSTEVTSLAYTDLTVADGSTYNYIVESVDAEGNTSVPSNTATLAIPANLSAAVIAGNTT